MLPSDNPSEGLVGAPVIRVGCRVIRLRDLNLWRTVGLANWTSDAY